MPPPYPALAQALSAFVDASRPIATPAEAIRHADDVSLIGIVSVRLTLPTALPTPQPPSIGAWILHQPASAHDRLRHAQAMPAIVAAGHGVADALYAIAPVLRHQDILIDEEIGKEGIALWGLVLGASDRHQCHAPDAYGLLARLVPMLDALKDRPAGTRTFRVESTTFPTTIHAASPEDALAVWYAMHIHTRDTPDTITETHPLSPLKARVPDWRRP